MSWAAPPSHAVQLWRELAGAPTAFAPGSRISVRGSRGICPPGWIGAVCLGDAFVLEVAAGSDETVADLFACDDPTDPTEVVATLSPAETLGPGVLAYLPAEEDLARHRIAPPPGVTFGVEPVAVLADWLGSLPSDEVEESGIDELEEVVVARSADRPVAAAGHHVWPTAVAHLGVVTDPGWRGRGLGVAVGRHAVERATSTGLAPQWRARHDNAASRAAARRLGFVEVGRQFSIRPA